MSAAQGSAPLLRSAHDLALLSILFLCSLCVCVCESMIIRAELDQSNWPAVQLVKQQFNFCSKNILLGGAKPTTIPQNLLNQTQMLPNLPTIYVIQTYALYGNSILNNVSTWRCFWRQI